MSAVRRTSLRGRRLTKYRSPRAWTALRSRSSGLVSRPLFARITARAEGADAQDLRFVITPR